MLALVMAAGAAGSADAQTPTWRVLAGDHPQIVTPGLPTGAWRSFNSATIGNVGQQQFHLRPATPTALQGHWGWSVTEFVRFAATGSAGVDGPGRTGAEAGHVFKSLSAGGGGAGPDGQRLFFAQAGVPGTTANDLWGLWRWNGTRNIELARPLTDGPLGPGLGAGWNYPNNGFASSLSLPGSGALMHAEVRNANNAARRLVARHNGQAAQPCLLSSATEAHLAPGLTPGDSFASFLSGLDRFSVSRYGVVHARLPASGSRSGYWTLCNGAPRAFAANNETGRLGPDIGQAGAVFANFPGTSPHASGSDGVMFWADWRVPPASARTGLFRNDGRGNNRPVLMNDAAGFHGPNWQGAVWNVFNTGSLSVADEYAAFTSSVTTTDNTTVSGLWRVRAGDRPEPLALIGISGYPFEPEPGRLWVRFSAVAALANGDVVVEADTNPGNITDLWLFPVDGDPRRILTSGGSVVMPTTSGNVETTFGSITVPTGGSRHASGEDGWVGDDGTLVVRVSTGNHGALRLTTQLQGVRGDALFSSGLQ